MGVSRLSCPQSGQHCLASVSFWRDVHRQHRSRPMMPTGAAQFTQSRCRFPNALNHLHDTGCYIGGIDRPRLLTDFAGSD